MQAGKSDERNEASGLLRCRPDAVVPPLEMELRLHLADSWRGGPVFSRFDIYNTPYRIICVYLTRVSTKRPTTQKQKHGSEEAGTEALDVCAAPGAARRRSALSSLSTMCQRFPCSLSNPFKNLWGS